MRIVPLVVIGCAVFGHPVAGFFGPFALPERVLRIGDPVPTPPVLAPRGSVGPDVDRVGLLPRSLLMARFGPGATSQAFATQLARVGGTLRDINVTSLESRGCMHTIGRGEESHLHEAFMRLEEHGDGGLFVNWMPGQTAFVRFSINYQVTRQCDGVEAIAFDRRLNVEVTVPAAGLAIIAVAGAAPRLNTFGFNGMTPARVNGGWAGIRTDSCDYSTTADWRSTVTSIIRIASGALAPEGMHAKAQSDAPILSVDCDH